MPPTAEIKVFILIQTIQVLQLILFIIPGLVLIAMGVVILIKPVSVINRRWYWFVFLPLILANPLALIENSPIWPGIGPINWRVGLILAADIFLVIWIILTFRGTMVFGLGASETLSILKETLQSMDYEVEMRTGEKRVLLGRALEARILNVSRADVFAEIWISERFNEVVIRTDSKAGRSILKTVLASLRQMEKPYDFKDHVMGVLYIVLAVVFAVLGWIFFFEPRLILID